MSKERLFTPRAAELEAILKGRQTQFRRPIKPPPRHCPAKGIDGRWYHINYKREPVVAAGEINNPFGKSGDLLRLKERWLIDCPYGPPEGCDNPDHVYYWEGEPAPDNFPMPWRPAITMPRWATRHTLCVLKMHAEQVKSIDEIGAQKQGWFYQGHNLQHAYDPVTMDTARRWFIGEWDAAHAAQGLAFELNPFCWVVEFKIVPLGYISGIRT